MGSGGAQVEPRRVADRPLVAVPIEGMAEAAPADENRNYGPAVVRTISAPQTVTPRGASPVVGMGKEVDYLGYVFGTQQALHWMLPRNQGHIIQIGSALAYRAIPLQSAYCAAKFALAEIV